MTDPHPFEPEILYLDNHLVAVRKPAGILIQSDDSGEPSLLERVKEWLKKESGKPGNVYLGMVHRLDRPVSGVTLFARTSKAASRLSEQFRQHTTRKIYRAVVEGSLWPESASLVHYLRKEKTLKATVFPRETPQTQRAELSYTLVESLARASIVEIELVTGRFHQIRAQLSFAGYPILGDVKYGAHQSLPERQIALYAMKLIFAHPVTKEEITLESPPPKGWPFVQDTLNSLCVLCGFTVLHLTL